MERLRILKLLIPVCLGFHLLGCSHESNSKLSSRFEDLDSAYARIGTDSFFFKGKLFVRDGESLEVFQKGGECYFFYSVDTLTKEFKMEIGILGDARLVDLNNDRRNEIILKTFSGNSADDYLLLFQEGKPFLRVIDIFLGQSEIIKDTFGQKYLITYTPDNCRDLGWKSKLLTLKNDEVVENGELEYDGCSDSVKTIIGSMKNSQNFQIPFPEEINLSDETIENIIDLWLNVLSSSKNE